MRQPAIQHNKSTTTEQRDGVDECTTCNLGDILVGDEDVLHLDVAVSDELGM